MGLIHLLKKLWKSLNPTKDEESMGTGLKALSNVTPKDERIINITAYHEAGHTLMAYFVGWSVNNIEIVFNGSIVDHGVTRYSHGTDTRYVSLIAEKQNDFNTLTIEEKIECAQAGQKRIFSIMGGPIAEKIFINGGVNKGFYIDFSDNTVPDSRIINQFDYFLRACDNQHDHDFVTKGLNQVATLFSQSVFWNPIERIAKVLSKTHYIDGNRIEEILDDTGFTVYMEKFRN